MTRRERYELRECVLERSGWILINWLPGRWARVGLCVLGEEDDGCKTPGWKVREVLPHRPRPKDPPHKRWRPR